MHATCTAHLTVLDVIRVVTLGEQCQPWDCSLCRFVQSSVTSAWVKFPSLLSAVFSSTLNPYFPLMCGTKFQTHTKPVLGVILETTLGLRVLQLCVSSVAVRLQSLVLSLPVMTASAPSVSWFGSNSVFYSFSNDVIKADTSRTGNRYFCLFRFCINCCTCCKSVEYPVFQKAPKFSFKCPEHKAGKLVCLKDGWLENLPLVVLVTMSNGRTW